MRFRGKLAGAVLTTVVVAAGALAAMPLAGAQSTTTTTAAAGGTDTAGDALTVNVGVNDPKDPNIAVLQYMPAKVSVPVGGTIDFSWARTIEPHSVTFLAPGQTLPAPGSDPTLFVGAAPTAAYDGTAFVNSGLFPLGPGTVPPFEMTFAKSGTFQYYCVIHPTMVGSVEVVDSGRTTTVAQAEAQAKAQEAKWLAEGRKAKAKLVAEATSAKPTKGTDGARTWTIQMGTTTAHTDVLAFAPQPKKIKAGDSVTFVNNSGAPHTATFSGTSGDAITNPLDPRTEQAIPGPSPQTLTAGALYNSGQLPPNAAAPGGQPPPEAVRSFTFVVPDAGSYSYYCILHVTSGMGGSITAK